MQTSIWREILAYARWAPSPHNTQHWKFRLIDETHAVLMYDPSRLLPVEDGKGQFMAAGFGIILEMISIAAAPHGLELKTTLLNVPLDETKTEPTALRQSRTGCAHDAGATRSRADSAAPHLAFALQRFGGSAARAR